MNQTFGEGGKNGLDLVRCRHDIGQADKNGNKKQEGRRRMNTLSWVLVIGGLATLVIAGVYYYLSGWRKIESVPKPKQGKGPNGVSDRHNPKRARRAQPSKRVPP